MHIYICLYIYIYVCVHVYMCITNMLVRLLIILDTDGNIYPIVKWTVF